MLCTSKHNVRVYAGPLTLCKALDWHSERIRLNHLKFMLCSDCSAVYLDCVFKTISLAITVDSASAMAETATHK